MLRITVHESPEALTFQLEGRLAGPWVREVEECRRRALSTCLAQEDRDGEMRAEDGPRRAAAGRRCPAVRVDLTGVTFIDAAGQAYLAALYRQGAELVAADCLTKGIVAEITQEGERPRGLSSRRQ